MRHGLGDLIERLLDVAGDREDVAKVGDGDRLTQVDAQLEAVRPVKRGDLADALRAEAGARAVGGAAVERGAEHGDVVLAAPAHVLDVGRLEEGVDAREMRKLAARERRDASIDNGVCPRQAELEPAGNLLLPSGGRQRGLGLNGEAGFGAIVVVQVLGQRSSEVGCVRHRFRVSRALPGVPASRRGRRPSTMPGRGAADKTRTALKRSMSSSASDQSRECFAFISTELSIRTNATLDLYPALTRYLPGTDTGDSWSRPPRRSDRLPDECRVAERGRMTARRYEPHTDGVARSTQAGRRQVAARALPRPR